jgi:hypothetical protein
LASFWVRFFTIVNNDGQSLASFFQKKYFPAEPDRLGKSSKLNKRGKKLVLRSPSPRPSPPGEGETLSAGWEIHPTGFAAAHWGGPGGFWEVKLAFKGSNIGFQLG